jgi:3,4-dihydroxy 2-butanone 4-phosphate synthase/GTP cyclohydrolase II
MNRTMATHGRGLICAPLTESDVRGGLACDGKLQYESMETAFTVSVDLKVTGN